MAEREGGNVTKRQRGGDRDREKGRERKTELERERERGNNEVETFSLFFCFKISLLKN